MAVFRVEKNSGYTVMSNHHLRNQELSLKAKGLLSQMLSLPDNWDYTLKGLSLINREKIDAIREAIRELERAGYIVRSRERDEKGRLRGADYIIYEFPKKPVSDLPTLENPTLDNPTQENPTLENPTLENPTQLNKDILRTDLTDLEAQLEAMSLGGLIGLWFQSLFVGLTMNILSICIMLVIYGRMIQIYLVTSLGPIPLSTMANSEWRSVGQNYLKSLLALAFQAFLIMVCVGIYAVLIQTIGAGGDISGAIWRAMGYTVLLCFCLFKTGSMANAVFGAH